MNIKRPIYYSDIIQLRINLNETTGRFYSLKYRTKVGDYLLFNIEEISSIDINSIL